MKFALEISNSVISNKTLNVLPVNDVSGRKLHNDRSCDKIAILWTPRSGAMYEFYVYHVISLKTNSWHHPAKSIPILDWGPNIKSHLLIIRILLEKLDQGSRSKQQEQCSLFLFFCSAVCTTFYVCILEGAIKESCGFKATLFVDIKLRKCSTIKFIYSFIS